MNYTEELKATVSDLLTTGFNNASNALADIINKPVSLTDFSCHLELMGDRPLLTEDNEGDLYVISTMIIGDLKGISYFILSEEACRFIYEACNVDQSLPDIKRSVLSEIDNIISATFISNLSDNLNINIYGDVPNYLKLNGKVMPEERNGFSAGHNCSVFSEVKFEVSGYELNMRFAWYLSEKILHLLQTDKVNSSFKTKKM